MTYKTLPPHYRYAATLDFLRNRRQLKAVAWLGLALVVVPALGGLLLMPVQRSWNWLAERWYRWPGLFAALLLYIPLHELTHGIAMFMLSGVPPKYGLKLPYAWCGSTVWFDRKGHIITALAPVALWGVGIQLAIARAPAEWFWPLWVLQISNLSGSAGDMWCVWELMRMEGELLIQDTGVRMRVMRKTNDEDRPR